MLHAVTEREMIAPSTPVFVDFENVGVTYQTRKGNITALTECSFSIGQGEFVSVLGPSGCGKSTLLRVVSGLIEPSAGRVTVGGKPVTTPRDDVGIVFQKPTLLPWKTVINNVLSPIRARGRVDGASRDRARQLLALVGLAEFEAQYPHELSGGMQQRVGIARALVSEPRLLLMDEPFAALDAMSRERMSLELQRIWAQTGTSVLFITHSIPEAVFLSDRVVTLSERPGTVIDDLTVPLERPRGLETMRTEAFAEACDHLRRLFGTETPN